MIGIMSAMYDEMAELLQILKHKKTTVLGNREYYTGTIGQQKVVMVFSKWGKVSAAITTTEFISTFKPSEIIFSGVAGAIHKDLNIGDIVYGTSLLQHDMDASPLFAKHEIPLLNKTIFKTANNPKLLNCTCNFKNNYFDKILKSNANRFDIQEPKVMSGLIASGDVFISSTTKIKEMQSLLPKLQCVEMEGAAVAQVCDEYQIPFSIIRIISDKADENAAIDFPDFTKQIASQYTKGILENYCS